MRRAVLPAGVATYLDTSGVDHVVVMGGEAALSADVETAVKGLGVSVTRIAGASRYDTAVKAAELVAGRYSTTGGQDCFATATVGLARARVPFDSFSAAPLLSRLCAPLVLADPRQIPADTAAFLDTARTANAAVDLRIFGGDAAVSQTAIDTYLADTGASEPDEDEAAPAGLPAGTCGGSADDEPRQLFDSDRAEDASWAPDCSKIVYTRNGSLWTANVDGSGNKQLVQADGGYLAQAAWSPDGTRIAYVRDYWDGINGRSHLWIVNADGSGKTKLSRGDVHERWPAWSPDGTRIVFEHVSGSGRDADGFFVNADRYIVTMDADGRDREVLRRGGHSEESPAWSPDGGLLAFTSFGSVQVSEVDGSNPRTIIAGGYWNGGLSFSPEGRRIAFVRGDGTRSSIHVANIDGTDEQVIFDREVQAVAPRWSPDGQRILFHTIDDENRRRIYVAGARGDSVRDTSAQCKPRGVGQFVTVGFPLPAGALPSTGKLRVAVLFMDFPDAQATHTTHEEAALGLPYAEAYMEAVSDGKLDVEFVPHHEWLRAGQPFRHYATLTTATNRTSLSSVANLEAAALADEHLDFSDIDVALTVFTGTHFTAGISLGELGEADGNTFTLASVGNEIRPAAGEPLDWGWVAAHELVHKFGLVDYGPYDSSLHEATDPVPPGKSKVDVWWGLMQMHSWFYADSTDPRLRHTWQHRNGQTATGYDTYLVPHEMLAWSRWQLGWLDEAQMRCINDDEATVSLAPIAQPGDGIAMAAVPLNAREVIVIESRRKQGFDHSRDYTAPNGWRTTYPRLISEGVLVYTVDALTQSGELPLKVAGDTGNGQVDDFPVLQAGESVAVSGYTITVTADNGNTHTVSISRSN